MKIITFSRWSDFPQLQISTYFYEQHLQYIERFVLENIRLFIYLIEQHAFEPLHFIF